MLFSPLLIGVDFAHNPSSPYSVTWTGLVSPILVNLACSERKHKFHISSDILDSGPFPWVQKRQSDSRMWNIVMSKFIFSSCARPARYDVMRMAHMRSSWLPCSIMSRPCLFHTTFEPCPALQFHLPIEQIRIFSIYLVIGSSYTVFASFSSLKYPIQRVFQNPRCITRCNSV